jgi:hypothetical protein
MLNLLRTIIACRALAIPKEQRKPFAVLALALAAGLALAVLYQQPNQQPNSTTNQEADNGDASWWDWRFSPEVIFTGIIAVFSFLSYWEFKKSGERQLRAYVWLDAIEIRDVGVGSKPYIQVQMRNAGQTPAHDLIISSAIGMEPYPLPLTTPWPALEPAQEDPKTALYPGSEAPLRYTNIEWQEDPLTQQQFDTIMKGEPERLYIFVHAAYWDVFRKKRRNTYYCVSVDASKTVLDKDLRGDMGFEFAPVHNWSD